jgi:hypothetical protein
MLRSYYLIALIAFLASCTSFHPWEDNALRKSLASFHLDNPDSDVRLHLSKGDFRPLGVHFGDDSCWLGDHANTKIVDFGNRVGIRCIDGSTAIPEDADHQKMLLVAYAYARAYNEALLRDTGGHFYIRFNDDGLTWKVPDQFVTMLKEESDGGIDWTIYSFWKEGAFGDCKKNEECGMFVRILPRIGHHDKKLPPSRISISSRDGTDLPFKLVTTSLQSEKFPYLRYIGSQSKFHYFVMAPSDLGYVDCWSGSDAYLAPAVEPHLGQDGHLQCWTALEMPNRSSVTIQIWGAQLSEVGLLITQLRPEILKFIQ